MSEFIDDLRQRWDEEPSPQLSLQLAEEYKRLDRRKDAVHVLSLALEEHPEHVAARVALGRFRLEMGEEEEARRLLEGVVNEDPTHLVASKLLVGLYLEGGEKKQARDRLDLYKLLNESDPEIEVLEARLSGAVVVEEPRVVVVDIPRNGDPFQDLWSGVDSVSYWQAIDAEGIFPVARKPRPVERRMPTAPEVEVPGTTVTLANLYLQQGHLEDAEEAFLEILDREPDSSQAAAGLEEARRLRAAHQAQEERPAEAQSAVGGDMTSRKVEVLRDYLQRIRAAGNRE